MINTLFTFAWRVSESEVREKEVKSFFSAALQTKEYRTITSHKHWEKKLRKIGWLTDFSLNCHQLDLLPFKIVTFNTNVYCVAECLILSMDDLDQNNSHKMQQKDNEKKHTFRFWRQKKEINKNCVYTVHCFQWELADRTSDESKRRRKTSSWWIDDNTTFMCLYILISNRWGGNYFKLLNWREFCLFISNSVCTKHPHIHG